ncbi:nicotinate-nucleotide adenylyltransferase [Desulfobaculum xiamenense]|uniref:Probable nicotinate-nucleotide adenylyltransferase n=1 Tax=Desulfobaculum xiamenense TaxID=995050 RepID=A0A846QGI9_9BACT|nr:nicotinate-nucleotide adenylyltransferase [Desulfobaculum xiamenense]
MARIGLLGGCFNPVHNGHVRLAVETLEQLALDWVELIPAAVPPHKAGPDMLDFELRAAMVDAAVDGVAGLRVNRVEAERSGPSYTVDTLTLLRETRPGDEFWFIMGACDLHALPHWNRGMRIPEMVNLAVANRIDEDLDRVTAFVAETWPDAVCEGEGAWRFGGGTRLDFVCVPRIDVSSSFVRERWCAGRRLRGLVPGGVERCLDAERERVARQWVAS